MIGPSEQGALIEAIIGYLHHMAVRAGFRRTVGCSAVGTESRDILGLGMIGMTKINTVTLKRHIQTQEVSKSVTYDLYIEISRVMKYLLRN
jgi:hypothetical protein